MDLPFVNVFACAQRSAGPLGVRGRGSRVLTEPGSGHRVAEQSVHRSAVRPRADIHVPHNQRRPSPHPRLAIGEAVMLLALPHHLY